MSDLARRKGNFRNRRSVVRRPRKKVCEYGFLRLDEFDPDGGELRERSSDSTYQL